MTNSIEHSRNNKHVAGLFILILFSFCFSNSYRISAQGLNYELGFNYEYDTTPICIVSDGSDTFMAYSEVYFEASIRLCKIDSTGSILWQKYFNAHGLNPIDKMIPDGQGGVYVAGDTNGICDVWGPNQGYIVRYDSLGNILWSDTYGDAWPNPTYVSGLHLSENGFIKILRMDWYGATTGSVMTYSETGFFFWETEISSAFVTDFIDVSIYPFVTYHGSNITAHNTSGGIENSVDYPLEIVDVEVLNDTIYVMFSDIIMMLNNNLSLVSTATFDGYDNFSQLKIINGEIQFLSSADTQKHIITTNNQLELIDVDTYDIPGLSGVEIDFSESHLSVLENYDLSDYNAVRLRNFHRESPINNLVNNTDIGIVDVNISGLEEASFDNIIVDATVTVKNYGDNSLTEFHLLHMLWYDICAPYFYNQPFEDINLAPGDSIDVQVSFWGPFSYDVHPDGSFTVDLCLYTGNPNSLVDTDVSNDAFCQSIDYHLCPTDLEGDGKTDGVDFTILLGSFGINCAPDEDCPTDFDGNGITDGDDFSVFLGSYGFDCQ